jgi:predicted ATP-binding protein involved in virulence
MYVEKLTMKDFRCFEQAEVTFVYPGKAGLPAEALKNVTLLIGINGTGKTSVLKGVALAQLSPIVGSSGLFPRHFVRIDQKSRTIRECELTTTFPVTERWRAKTPFDVNQDLNPGSKLTIRRIGDTELYRGYEWYSRTQAASGFGSQKYSPTELTLSESDPGPFYQDSSDEFFLLGYGAYRRTGSLEHAEGQRSRLGHLRHQRVAGIFDDAVTLYPLSAWSPRPETEPRRNEIRELLNDLLPEGTSFTGEFKDADAIFKHNGVKLPFGALSDGFRSYIGLVADMLYHLNYVCPKKSKLTDLSGVVMIDDIDVHLHPKWQREVVPKLAGTFPKLQFIITSHSPLVAGTLHAANIRVVEDNRIHEYTERIHGLTADQILTSSYFMLDTSRSPAAVDKLSKIEKRIADTLDPAAAIEYIRELTGGGKTNGAKKNGPKHKKK